VDISLHTTSRGDLLAVAAAVVAVVLTSMLTGYMMHTPQSYLPINSQPDEFQMVNLSENPAALGHMIEIERLAAIYRGFHKPTENVYDCKYMAMDFWNMAIASNYNAEIMIGNVDQNISTPSGTNHAWVIVEVAPGQWVAADPVVGVLSCSVKEVCAVSNPRYYRGWAFKSPPDFVPYVRWV
jgi:hypothetical protein